MPLERLLQHITPLFIAIGLASCAHAPAPVTPGVSLELAQQRRAQLDDVHYALFLSLPADPEAPIPGRMAISFTLANGGQPLQLDFREDPALIGGVTVNGALSSWRFEAEHLVIPQAELKRGNNTVEVTFNAGSSSLNRNPDYLYTLFVPDRARTAFPLFDQPDIKATWDLTLELPRDWRAISAGPLLEERVEGERKTLRFDTSDLLSSYLFSFVAGRFEAETREVGGRQMTLLYREPDAEKFARNIDEIFRLHGQALAWLEDYTGIDFPFQKLDFAAIPAFQYGGMEHVGAIQYNAGALFLEEAPSDGQLLDRANLIAHEVAHMWFGDLVTMRWFDDVWTKEVFANFMAAKIVNPAFPQVDHELNFLVSHYPSAYSVDRSAGANPIRQPLANLNDAGQMYGSIIYHKAPIMMRQLELLLGEEAFHQGMRNYLRTYAYGNADWPALIAILDELTDYDLAAWSGVWVNTPGRPEFRLAGNSTAPQLEQIDPAGEGRLWPQRFSLLTLGAQGQEEFSLLTEDALTPLPEGLAATGGFQLFSADGRGYGLFPAQLAMLERWQELDAVARGTLLINLYENLVDARGPAPGEYLDRLSGLLEEEDNQLLLELMLGQIQRIYWTMLPAAQRDARAAALEETVWENFSARDSASQRKLLFGAYAQLALTPAALQRVHAVWSGEFDPGALPLSETDRIALAQQLAIKLPGQAAEILATQLENTRNPDQQRRLRYLLPSLSADPGERDAFFAALADERMRRTESWVTEAVANLHHPLRREHSVRYIPASLALLREIQVTGDIFFPSAWLQATLANHNSAQVVADIETFLDANPDYYPQLRMKILQAADPVFRANRLLH
ncbi:M1 family metallopeptidase [Haliea sp. E17]|uniref:M1 family metallopeptidase n=1 Tax=Haliea sp. E17 TaxID=3401576 RepID=UPI003AABB206